VFLSSLFLLSLHRSLAGTTRYSNLACSSTARAPLLDVSRPLSLHGKTLKLKVKMDMTIVSLKSEVSYYAKPWKTKN
jgi:hypothetical protein